MRRRLQQVRVVVAALVASVRAGARRVLRGPTVHGWTWTEELFVATSRAAAVTSARHIELMAPRPGAWAPPLPRPLRKALRIEHVDLDGVSATRYIPQGDPSGTILYLHGGGFVTGSVASRAPPGRRQGHGVELRHLQRRLPPRPRPPVPRRARRRRHRLPGGPRPRRRPRHHDPLRRIRRRRPGAQHAAEDPRPRPPAARRRRAAVALRRLHLQRGRRSAPTPTSTCSRSATSPRSGDRRTSGTPTRPTRSCPPPSPTSPASPRCSSSPAAPSRCCRAPS